MSEARAFWTKCSDSVVDAIFPRRCALCEELSASPICPVCVSFLTLNETSEQIEENLQFRCPIYAYSDTGRDAVRLLKFYRRTALVKPMQDSLSVWCGQRPWLENWVIVPVPLHWTRLATRGFNQSELIARHLPSYHAGLLRRVRATAPQSSVDPKRRRENLADAFVASAKVAGLSVLLVDDVVTTGHTAQECAFALLKAGAKEVGLLTYAGNL